MKRVASNAKRAVVKRYGLGRKQSLNPARMAKDVARLAMMINAEKKIFSIGSANVLATGQNVGQVNINATGALAFDLTPLIGQGQTADSRNGNSIKLHSTFLQFQLGQQGNANTGMRVRVELWKTGGMIEDVAQLLNRLYVPSPFSTVIDYNSARNPDHYNNYQLIRKKVIYLKPDSISGAPMNAYVKMPIKWNGGKGHHIRYTSGTITNNPLTDLQAGQFFMVYFADNGNSNLASSSTLNVPVQISASGAVVRMSYRHYFYDN